MSEYRIDLHQHVLPPQYVDAFERAGTRLYGGAGLPHWSSDGAIAMMDARTIATGVLSLSTPGVTPFARAQAADLARVVNEFQAELVKDRPDRFGMFATIPLPDVTASLTEIAYVYDVLNADGVVLLGNSNGVYLGDPALDEVMAELDRREALVFIHPAQLPGPTMLGAAPALVDFLLDTTRAAVNLVTRGATRRYPQIRFVLSHAGGFVPYAAWRIAELHRDFIDSSSDPDTDPAAPTGPEEILAALAGFYFDTALSASPTALPSLLTFAGADHVVFGSDWPYAADDVLDTFLANHDQLLIDHDARAVNYATAQRLIPRLTHSHGDPYPDS